MLHKNRPATALAALGVSAVIAAGCGGGGSTSSSPQTPSAATARGQSVLPVAENPISNNATAPGLTITKVLVENNVSPETGKAVDDHLEVTLENSSRKPLDQIGIYYKITDPTKQVSEGYYTELGGLTIKPGVSEIVNFDDTGAEGHYPVNQYSLYYTDQNELVVDVMASSPGVKPATFSVKKDSGGAEAGVE